MTRAYDRTSTKSGLTDTDILDIRRESAILGLSERELARKFNVHHKTIHNIKKNVTWKHVPQPKTINAFRNYEVYPDGRIYSKNSQSFLKPILRKNGETQVRLSSGGTAKYFNVATLVAKAFLTRKRKFIVNYVDGNPSNTHYQNLTI